MIWDGLQQEKGMKKMIKYYNLKNDIKKKLSSMNQWIRLSLINNIEPRVFFYFFIICKLHFITKSSQGR